MPPRTVAKGDFLTFNRKGTILRAEIMDFVPAHTRLSAGQIEKYDLQTERVTVPYDRVILEVDNPVGGNDDMVNEVHPLKRVLQWEEYNRPDTRPSFEVEDEEFRFISMHSLEDNKVIIYAERI